MISGKDKLIYGLTPAQKVRVLCTIEGITLTDIAKALGVPLQVVSDVVHGRRHTPLVRETIARTLGVSEEDLFREPAS